MNFVTMFAGGFADSSFARLFTEMNPWCIGLFVVGLIFCIVEVFTPGFGFFGAAGAVCIVIGIILRLAMGGDGWMLVYMLLIFSVILVVLFIVLSKAINKGKLGKSDIFNVGTAVPEGITEGTNDFTNLLGEIGVSQTILRPIGRAKFGDKVVDVVARDGFIEVNKDVKVVEVEGQRVIVIEV